MACASVFDVWITFSMLFTMADVEIGNTHIQIYHNRFPTEIHFEYAKVTIKMKKVTQQQQQKKKKETNTLSH